MIIGSVILGIVILLAVLGLLKRTLESFRVSTVVAIIILLACPLLMLIPDIYIGGRFAFNIGGYLIPMIGIIGLMFILGWTRNLLRAVLATLAVTTVVTLSYLFIPFSPIGMQITAVIITGLVAGGVAYLIAGTSPGSFLSAIFGVMLADVAVFVVNVIRGVEPTLILGSRISFSVWVLAAVTAVAIYELVRMYRARTMRTPATKRNLKYEFGDDFSYRTSVNDPADHFRRDDYDDTFND